MMTWGVLSSQLPGPLAGPSPQKTPGPCLLEVGPVQIYPMPPSCTPSSWLLSPADGCFGVPTLTGFTQQSSQPVPLPPSSGPPETSYLCSPNSPVLHGNCCKIRSSEALLCSAPTQHFQWPLLPPKHGLNPAGQDFAPLRPAGFRHSFQAHRTSRQKSVCSADSKPPADMQ